MGILIFQNVQENSGTHTGKCIDCKGSGVNECANTDNMSNVHCKFKRPDARLTSVWRMQPCRPGMWPASQRRHVAFCPCF